MLLCCSPCACWLPPSGPYQPWYGQPEVRRSRSPMHFCMRARALRNSVGLHLVADPFTHPLLEHVNIQNFTIKHIQISNFKLQTYKQANFKYRTFKSPNRPACKACVCNAHALALFAQRLHALPTAAWGPLSTPAAVFVCYFVVAYIITVCY